MFISLLFSLKGGEWAMGMRIRANCLTAILLEASAVLDMGLDGYRHR